MPAIGGRSEHQTNEMMNDYSGNRGGNMIMMKPSRFLTELSNDLTEPMELEEGLPHLIAGPAPEEA